MLEVSGGSCGWIVIWLDCMSVECAWHACAAIVPENTQPTQKMLDEVTKVSSVRVRACPSVLCATFVSVCLCACSGVGIASRAACAWYACDASCLRRTRFQLGDNGCFTHGEC